MTPLPQSVPAESGKISAKELEAAKKIAFQAADNLEYRAQANLGPPTLYRERAKAIHTILTALEQQQVPRQDPTAKAWADEMRPGLLRMNKAILDVLITQILAAQEGEFTDTERLMASHIRLLQEEAQQVPTSGTVEEAIESLEDFAYQAGMSFGRNDKDDATLAELTIKAREELRTLISGIVKKGEMLEQFRDIILFEYGGGKMYPPAEHKATYSSEEMIANQMRIYIKAAEAYKALTPNVTGEQLAIYQRKLTELMRESK